MRHLATHTSKRPVVHQSSPRRLRRNQPTCVPLEDRRLLSVVITKSTPAGHLVGTPVIWTAAARGRGAAPVYRFSVKQPGGVFHVVRDFSQSKSFAWNPMQEGEFRIKVDVKSSFLARPTESTVASYKAITRVDGDAAVVSPTTNPLVAIYSAPPSPGSSMHVQFAEASANPSWHNTAPLRIARNKSTNFIVAGMLPNTTYLMRHVLNDGKVSSAVSFTTGSLPENVKFPSFAVLQPPASGADLSQSVIFHAGIDLSATIINTVATNLNGDVVWYYDSVTPGTQNLATNLEPGGTVMLLVDQSPRDKVGIDTLRQIDLAGNVLRETNVSAVNARLAAMGKPRITEFHHEAKLLPNGQTVVLASRDKVVNYKGKPTRFTGDEVLVLDQNFQPVWVWDSFQWLSTNRIGTDQAVPTDWLHSNAVSWSPADKNLVVSMRTQDWAVKINYANGRGNGRLLWKLGAQGTFRPITNVARPWFSHQHDLRYVNNNTVIVFDNGNIRHNVDPTVHSRGQVWTLNERAKTATLVVNADMGNYSAFLGGAQLLPNGNLAFTSGALFVGGKPTGQSIQVLQDGTRVYVQQISLLQYRSYFYSTLYSAGLLG